MCFTGEILPALDMLKSTLLYIKQGLNAPIGAFSPVIIEDTLQSFIHPPLLYYSNNNF